MSLPLNSPANPINRQPTGPSHIVIRQCLPLTPIEPHPLNLARPFVEPIQPLLIVVEIQRHDVGQSLQNHAQLSPVRGQIPNVVAVTVQQVRGDAAVLAACTLVRLTDVAWGALAVVRTHGVLADLAADGGCIEALVHVLACLAVGHEAVTGVTGAVVGGQGVVAELGAFVDRRVAALVDAWMDKRRGFTFLHNSSSVLLNVHVYMTTRNAPKNPCCPSLKFSSLIGFQVHFI